MYQILYFRPQNPSYPSPVNLRKGEARGHNSGTSFHRLALTQT